MTTYTADDFAKARFAEVPGKHFAARVDRHSDVLQWKASDGDWYSDEHLAAYGWVPVPAGSYTRTTSPDLMDGGVTSALTETEAEDRAHAAEKERPVTVTEEMVERAWDRWIDLDPQDIHSMRLALTAALTEPTPEPTDAELHAAILAFDGLSEHYAPGDAMRAALTAARAVGRDAR